jgi:hypothetical protein
MQQDFGIALRAEQEALRFELAPELAVVVDLAVVRDPVAAVGGSPSAARRRPTDR